MFRRSVRVWSLYSQGWTTLTTLSTPPLIPLSTRELLTSSHCRIREDLARNDVTRVIIPLKDQDSANIVKMQLKDLSIKLQTTVQPIFVSRKIVQDLKECETKLQLVNQQCVVYQFKCNLCDTGSFVGYPRSSSVRKHYDNDHAGAFLEDLLSCFKVLKQCMNKFYCLLNEKLYIKQFYHMSGGMESPWDSTAHASSHCTRASHQASRFLSNTRRK